MCGKIKFNKEDKIADMPDYSIFMVIGDGWYVLDKLNHTAKRFGFERYDSYLVVLDYVESNF